MAKPKVAVVGASGYTGLELARILSRHEAVELVGVTSETHRGKMLSDLHPSLACICDMTLIPMEEMPSLSPEIVFLALPHGTSMEFVRDHGVGDFRIVDLSGDFRLKSAGTYEKWYGKPHVCPQYLEEAVFGLAELYPGEIAAARLVANPGCYPTSAILALAPLLRAGLVSPEGIIVDSKSGVTGAGAKAKEVTHFPTANEDVKAYAIGAHRHQPEMEQCLGREAGTEVRLLFAPHMVPLSRGILTTAYAPILSGTTQESVDRAYRNAYSDRPFVRVRKEPPPVKAVRGANYCDVYARVDERSERVVTISVIDNLVKGAAGQAVQNMNLMLGIEPAVGLGMTPVSP
ncbi:MAG: N-acetyl-gamma-glutamyl-phosphate reductase [Acidobacteriota bacterium]|jgi:N-acetyl-gamma-glutamyl-phosphate reductase